VLVANNILNRGDGPGNLIAAWKIITGREKKVQYETKFPISIK